MHLKMKESNVSSRSNLNIGIDSISDYKMKAYVSTNGKIMNI